MNAVTNVAQESYEGLMDSSFYSGVAGVAVGGVLGSVITLLPFYKLGMFGNITRTVATMGSGAYLVMKSNQVSGDMQSLYRGAGAILGFIGASQVVGYLTATTGLSIPGFNGLGSVLTGSFESEGEEVIAQRGDGRVLGQETATQSYSDIYNADTLEEGTVEMQNRVSPNDPLNSVVEESPLGHGVTQWFGADGVSATGGVAQSFGGVAESSTMSHAPQTNVSHYVSSVDSLGTRAMNLNKGSALVQSAYAKGYEPPVHYSAEEPTVNVGQPTPTPMAGSMPDLWSAYAKPGTTAEETIMDTVRIMAPGQPIQWYGAETSATGIISNHVSSAEGFGSVVGQ